MRSCGCVWVNKPRKFWDKWVIVVDWFGLGFPLQGRDLASKWNLFLVGIVFIHEFV